MMMYFSVSLTCRHDRFCLGCLILLSGMSSVSERSSTRMRLSQDRTVIPETDLDTDSSDTIIEPAQIQRGRGRKRKHIRDSTTEVSNSDHVATDSRSRILKSRRTRSRRTPERQPIDRHVRHVRKQRYRYVRVPVEDKSVYNEYSSDSSSEGESYNFVDDKYTPPATSFGGKVGENIPRSILKKIRKNQFIEMHELLLNYNNDDEQYSLQLDRNNLTKFVKNSKPSALNFTQWCEAYDIFTAGYIEQHPQNSPKRTVERTKDLLTYKRNLSSYMKQGNNWLGYDRHFRKDLEAQNVSWATIRFDLIMQYTTYPARRFPEKINKHTGNEKQGFCQFCNTIGRTCYRVNCDRRHLCFKCNNPISRVVIGREVDYRSRLIYVRYSLTNTTLCL